MTIADIRTLAKEAAAAGVGLGAFNVIHLENAEMFARAAEEAGAPVVMQISENAVKYHGGNVNRSWLARWRLRGRPRLCRPPRPRGVYRLVRRPWSWGGIGHVRRVELTADNVRVTAELTAWCHENGVSVEPNS